MNTLTLPGLRGKQNKHRAPDRIAALEAEVADLKRRLASADQLIRTVIVEKSDTYLDLRNAEQARDCAQAAAAVKDLQLRDLHTRIRDLEEQRGQAPAELPVTAQRFDTGPVLRAGKRPVPTWASGEDSSETTHSIPLAQLRTEVEA
ncbi:hypothetical protein ACH492_22415 [Streptomyces sp. NPDC019443]|uniref:hypothetical protein n=1 Tax=Streptomyces sp. NPDC019443 TaxID=3365061 RepID=UPI0037959595